MVVKLIDAIGLCAIGICNSFGDILVFLITTIRVFFTSRPKVQKIVHHMEQIGVDSTPVILLTGASTGMVLALQTYTRVPPLWS